MSKEMDRILKAEVAYNEYAEDLAFNRQTPSDIAEEQQIIRENYEEFSEDFEGLDENENNDEFDGFSIIDEANADKLEAAADEQFSESGRVVYEGVSEYTMIPDPQDDSISSNSES